MASGYPDYHTPTRPQKPFVGTGQTVKVYYTSQAVSAGSNTTITMFTVATGKKFAMSSGIISTDVSCIQRVEYKPVDVTTMVVDFDMRWQMIDSDIGAAIFPAGYYLNLKLFNNDTAERTFKITVWGNEENA